MALSAAVQESLFLDQLVFSLGFNTCDQPLLYQDYKGAPDLAKKKDFRLSYNEDIDLLQTNNCSKKVHFLT